MSQTEQSTEKAPRNVSVVQVRQAGSDHQVVSVKGGSGAYRRQPYGGCPWRIDQAGEFPAEAFVHSASTAYDMAQNMFACHESGSEKPATCAGFLLRGADHNLAVRLRRMKGDIGTDVTDGGHALFNDYRAMAEVNGVDPGHSALRNCRGVGN